MSEEFIPRRDGQLLQLACIAGAQTDVHFEVRCFRRDGGRLLPAGREWFPVDLRDDAVAYVKRRGDEDLVEVFLGIATRRQRGGTAADVKAFSALTLDADTEDAVEAARRHTIPPHLIVRTRPSRHQCWWSLREAVSPEDGARALARLAYHLGGDAAATDPARVLRAVGSRNWKDRRGFPVRAIEFNPGGASTPLLEDVVAGLSDPPTPPRASTPRVAHHGGGDPLLTIPATEYVPALIGRELGRDGKVACPFHAEGRERSPSLHVYDETGWYCYGCGLGGSVIDLGAQLYGLQPRGRGYHDIRRRLAQDLLRSGAVAA